MQTERIAVSHPMMSYQFTVDNFAASQNDTDLVRVTGIEGATMPWPGSIVAIGASLSAAKTAGTLTFYASVGGTVTTFGAAVADDAAIAYASQASGKTRFDAGDLVGVMYASSADLSPGGTAEAIVDLYVVFDKVSV